MGPNRKYGVKMGVLTKICCFYAVMITILSYMHTQIIYELCPVAQLSNGMRRFSINCIFSEIQGNT